MPPALLEVIAEQSGATLFDMVYQPLATSFLGMTSGRSIDGLTMLVGQASRSFELFFGRPAPAANRALFDCLAGTR